MEIINTITNFFITSAYADTAATAATPAQQQGGGFSLVMMLGIFVVFMYFAVWRPQNKRAKEQRDLLGSLTKGDEVVTAGGILGKINKVSDNYVVLSLSDAVEITIQKSSIVGALPKGTLKSI
ncbi:MAG: preprotein translocase subunit YajC [Gammaproteobacteria bacterium]